MAVRARDGPVPPPAHPADPGRLRDDETTEARRIGACLRRTLVATQALADVPPSIGPVVFGTLGVGWVMVRCPRQYDELMRRAGGVWEPGARHG